MKRERYDDAIPYVCNTCGTEFPVGGYCESDGKGGTVIVPAKRGEVFCPNDDGYRWFRTGADGRMKDSLVPTHDVNWTGGRL